MNQEDNDGDTLGDTCDPDDDNDGVVDEEDAFPFDPNRSKVDASFIPLLLDDD